MSQHAEHRASTAATPAQLRDRPVQRRRAGHCSRAALSLHAAQPRVEHAARESPRCSDAALSLADLAGR